MKVILNETKEEFLANYEKEIAQEFATDNEFVCNALQMINYQHYLEYKEHAVNGLMIFGNKFLEGLGMALGEADDKDSVKIIRTWRNECDVHELLHRMHLAKQVALKEKAAD